jgi:hypothetical protein
MIAWLKKSSIKTFNEVFMRRGYMAIWRKIQDHEFSKEKRVYSKFEAWIDILLEAQHEETREVVIKMRLFECRYGESLKSIRTWGARWGWGEAKVKRFMYLLVKMNQIRYTNETVTTRITVLNYMQYDPRRNSFDTRLTHDRNATEDRQERKERKEKNIGKETPAFIYPEKYSDILKSKFNDFIRNRTELKKPVTEISFNSLVNKLDKLTGGNEQTSIEILENSIENGWAGIFEIKGKKPKQQLIFNLE